MIYGRGEHIFNYDAIIGTTWIGGESKHGVLLMLLPWNKPVSYTSRI
jgi:hypothetical protein